MNLSVNPLISTTLQHTRLQPAQLTHEIDAHTLPASNKRIKPIAYFLGQQRAEHALNLGLSMPFSGYHICAVGRQQLGKAEQILAFLQDKYRSQNIPIIYEQYPSISRLFGEVRVQQHQVHSVELGALQRANHGILLLDLEQLLQHQQVWSILKHSLKIQCWQWNTLPKSPYSQEQYFSHIDDIPLNVKVILLADADQYDELLSIDADVAQLFKIRADFNEHFTRTPEHEQNYLAWLSHIIQQQQLLAFNRHAFAEILTDASRQVESQQHLSLNADYITTLLQHAHFNAVQQQATIVDAEHVQTALTQATQRLSYWKELYWQEMIQGTLLITTQGQRLGQVNALSVIEYSDHEFGFPSRLTATVSQGAGDILDIERSVELGGALHAKATLLMSSFLKSHFGRQYHLNFSAAIAFEQSYGEIDGDSATIAELSAVISAISQIPIHQSRAITGSMNQLGQVQPVGGINAKIEGFFDACQLQGLTGQQGVIIPRQNVQHLMLRQDIIQAVAEQRFHIHAIENIEQALELLMNRPIGTPDKKGNYPSDSIYHAVIQQLEQWQNVDEHAFDEPSKKQKKKKSHR